MWLANGLRHGRNPAESASIRPTCCAVRTKVIDPACDTIPRPAVSTDNDGYHDVDSPTRKVLLELAIFDLRQAELSQFRASFFIHDTRPPPTSEKARG
ncbi:hypothetical protein [Mycobacterium servetii]|uniref:Uncharacterized protein n=1 Tax=Mycobacterium servetii TaxID=3237418 RepID=A0ABV4C6K6_9MYCO